MKKVFVYWNLRRGQWSVKDITPGSETYGKVIDRRREVILRDAVGKVSEAGRQRVLRERKKNVHAGIVGWLVEGLTHRLGHHIEGIGDALYYNPYRTETFVHVVDGSKFEGSPYVLLTEARRVFVA